MGISKARKEERRRKEEKRREEGGKKRREEGGKKQGEGGHTCIPAVKACTICSDENLYERSCKSRITALHDAHFVGSF
jgi:hypothetical protein